LIGSKKLQQAPKLTVYENGFWFSGVCNPKSLAQFSIKGGLPIYCTRWKKNAFFFRGSPTSFNSYAELRRSWVFRLVGLSVQVLYSTCVGQLVLMLPESTIDSTATEHSRRKCQNLSFSCNAFIEHPMELECSNWHGFWFKGLYSICIGQLILILPVDIIGSTAIEHNQMDISRSIILSMSLFLVSRFDINRWNYLIDSLIFIDYWYRYQWSVIISNQTDTELESHEKDISKFM